MCLRTRLGGCVNEGLVPFVRVQRRLRASRGACAPGLAASCGRGPISLLGVCSRSCRGGQLGLHGPTSPAAWTRPTGSRCGTRTTRGTGSRRAWTPPTATASSPGDAGFDPASRRCSRPTTPRSSSTPRPSPTGWPPPAARAPSPAGSRSGGPRGRLRQRSRRSTATRWSSAGPADVTGGLCARSHLPRGYPYGSSTSPPTPTAGSPATTGTTDVGCAPVAPTPATSGWPWPARSPTVFLRWDPAVAPAAPAGYLGDATTLHRITGATSRTAPARPTTSGSPGRDHEHRCAPTSSPCRQDGRPARRRRPARVDFAGRRGRHQQRPARPSPSRTCADSRR